MSLDERFVPLTSLNQTFFDKDTGELLSGGLMYFYQDQSRATLKTVYELTGGPSNYQYVALPNPITLSSVGTAMNAAGDNVLIYAYPYEGSPSDDETGDIQLYYLDCTNSAGTTQFTREAIPNLTADDDPTTSNFSLSNHLSNPQFSQYFLDSESSTIFTISGASLTEYPIAPDWTMVVTGTGTITLQRVAVEGLENYPTNPPYYLTVTTSSGITLCQFRQRLPYDSGLWSNGSIASCIVAARSAGTSNSIAVYYEESSGGDAIPLVASTALTSELTLYQDSAAIGNSANSQSGDSAYIDIYVDIPQDITLSFTSVQVVPTPGNVVADQVPYDQRSSNRELALMGDYYIPRLEEKPLRSYLVGWDFSLNPAQLGEAQTIDQESASGLASYIWDQTICGRTTDDVAVARNSVSGGMQFTTGGSDGTDRSFYVMQYLDGLQAQEILGNSLSVNVNAYVGDTDHDITARVYLFGAPSSAAFPTLTDSIINVTTGGIASLTSSASTAGWFAIPRSNLNAPVATLGAVTENNDLNNNDIDYGFNGWEITSSDNFTDFDKFAVVVTFVYAYSGQVITVDSVSCVPGDIPTRPAPQSSDDVLSECEYYYERSYEVGTATETQNAPNQYVANNAQRWENVAGRSRYLRQGFQLRFKSRKRIAEPTMTFYNPTLASSADNQVRLSVYDGATEVASANPTVSSVYTLLFSGGQDYLTYSCTPNEYYTSNGASEDFLYPVTRFHYVADARIGV